MSVASKNLFDLLGNDVEGSETPKAPVKTVTKSTISTAKTAADGSKPAQQSRAGFSRPQQEFRDNKGVGRAANQNRSTEERTADRPRGGRGARGRGGAGATRHRNADDRHAKNIAPGSEKQAAQSWGATDGNAELKDEQAGEAIAETEKQEAAEAEDVEAEPKEPEPKQVTLDAYYAERDSAVLNEGINIRKVSDVPDGVQVQKEDAEDYFAATGGKSKKTKNKKVKETIAWEDSGREERDTRGPRGGGSRGERGSRGDGPRGGRGGPRGGRGDGGAPRGGFPRGDGPRGGRGGPRGGRGAAAPNLSNTDDFPSLG